MLELDLQTTDKPKQAKIYNYLVLSCSKEAGEILLSCPRDDGLAAWNALAERYAASSATNVATLTAELFDLQWDKFPSLSAFKTAVMEIWRKMNATQSKDIPSEKVITAFVLKQLPPEFSSVVAHLYLSNSDALKTLQGTFDAIRQYQQAFGVPDRSDSRQPQADSALAAAMRRPRAPRRFKRSIWTKDDQRGRGTQTAKGSTAATTSACTFCGYRNHKESECRHRERASQMFKSTKGRPYPSRQVSYLAAEEDRNDTSFSFLAATVLDSHILTNPNIFILDSGASIHLIKDRSLFTEYEPMQAAITVANQSCVMAVAKGVIQFRVGDINLRVEEAYHVPDCVANLLSVQQLINRNSGCQFHMSSSGSYLQLDPTVTIPCKTVGKLAVIEAEARLLEPFGCISMDANSFHRIMGHANLEYIKQLAAKAKITLVGARGKHARECEVCIQAKAKDKPLPKKSSSSPENYQRGQLTFLDLAGPVTPQTPQGNKYVIVFVDARTRYTTVFLSKSKSDVVSACRQYYSLLAKAGIELPPGSTIQTDNGEARSKEFDALCAELKINHRFTAPHTPQENGSVERAIAVLFAITRALLIDSRLAHGLWGLAFKHAAYLRNRTPTTALTLNTPFEAMFGTAPELADLHIFGQTAFVRKAGFLHKLEPRTRKGLYVGRSDVSKSHLIYFPDSRRLVESRNVDFISRTYSDSTVTKDNSQFEEADESYRNPLDEEELQPQKRIALDESQDNQDTETSSEMSAADPPLPDQTTDESPPVESEPSAEDDFDPATLGHSERLRDSSLMYRDLQGRMRWVTSRMQASLATRVDNCLSDSEENMPKSLQEALSGHDAQQWKQAWEQEMESLRINNVMEPVPESSVPPQIKVINTKYVFKIKKTGEQRRFKVRLVARGYAQEAERELCYSPVVSMTTVRLVLSFAACKGWHMGISDFTTAFLNAPISDQHIYIQVPEGLPTADAQGHKLVFRLNRSLYGLRTSPSDWNMTLTKTLKNCNLQPAGTDNCLFTRDLQNTGGQALIACLFVDDMLLVSPDERIIADFRQKLSDTFGLKMTNQAPVMQGSKRIFRFLGARITQDVSQGTILLDQEENIKTLLANSRMENCRGSDVPAIPAARLSKDGELLESGAKAVFKSTIGALNYITSVSRPDLAASVNQLAKYLTQPTKEHWNAMKMVLRYLKSTSSWGITYDRNSKHRNTIVGYSDASYAGDLDTRRSTTGYVFCMNKGAISWRSRTQRVVAISTCESEFLALSEACQEAQYLRRLAQALDIPQQTVTIHGDNIPALNLAHKGIVTSKTKHIDLRAHFVQQYVSEGSIRLSYLETANMPADVLTKSLFKLKHRQHTDFVLGRSAPGGSIT